MSRTIVLTALLLLALAPRSAAQLFDLFPDLVYDDEIFDISFDGEWWDECTPSHRLVVDPGRQVIEIHAGYCPCSSVPTFYSDFVGPVGPLTAGSWEIQYWEADSCSEPWLLLEPLEYRPLEVLSAGGTVDDPTDPTDPGDPCDPFAHCDPCDPEAPCDPSDPSDPSDPNDPGVGLLEADFDWSPLAPAVGEPVQFFDLSIGEILDWEWSFGDGEWAFEPDPLHVFASPGFHPVTLTVLGFDDLASVTYDLLVEESPVVEFTAGVVAGSEGQGEIAVELVRTGGSERVEAEVAVVGGSARAGVDFDYAGEPVVWQGGETGSRWIVVPLVDDLVPEQSETIDLAIREAGGSLIGRRVVRLVVHDDDFAARPEETLDAGGTAARPVVASYSPDGLQESRRRQVVVWEGDDGQGRGIFARVLDPRGNELVAPFRVNQRRQGDQRNPRVVFDGRGRFVVVWEESAGERSGLTSRAAGSSLWGQFFDLGNGETGEQIEVVAEGDPSEPSVASDGEGEVVVTWEDGGEVVSRVVTDDGPVGAPISLGAGVSPEVARTGNGSTLVVWQAGSDGASPVAERSTGGSLFGSFFDVDGEPVAEEQPIEESAQEPSVAAGAGDEYVVAYVKPDDEGDGEIHATVYGVNGSSKVKRFRVDEVDRGGERAPAVAVNASGDFVVTWESEAGVHARFFDRRARPVGGDVEVAVSTAAVRAVAPEVTIDDDDRVRIVWERRRPDDSRDGIGSRLVEPRISSGCTPDSSTLCLQGERFEVRVLWRTPQGRSGVARAERLTEDTGYFWFFRDSNVEMLIKVLDACALNESFWVFAGGLTNVATEIVVTDTVSGQSRRYRNTLGDSFAPIQDTQAFQGCAVGASAGSDLPPAAAVDRLARVSAAREHAAAAAASTLVSRAGGCVPSSRRLCLAGGRFAVEADWRTPTGDTGSGRPVGLSDDTGYFWFFGDANVEMVVKVLDACAINRSFWVFAGGLTNVGVDWRVIDTLSGATVEYENPIGSAFRPIQDIGAFVCE